MWNLIWVVLGIITLSIHNSLQSAVTGAVAVNQLEDSIILYAVGKNAALGNILYDIVQWSGWLMIIIGFVLVTRSLLTSEKSKNETT